MGTVFRAFDMVRNEEVALKRLHSDDSDAIRRLKEEFRALADIVHENLVTLYDLISLDDQWCFTMELVRGVDFLTHVRGAPSAAGLSAIADPARLRAALTGLARGICALHKEKKLHCDIKPSNVMVTHNGRVVLLDFGLVTDLDPEPWRANGNDPIDGTPPYSAPERAPRKQPTPAADWYSFGVLLYEALTGRLPFEGDKDYVLSAKKGRDPTPPQQIEKSAPKDLSDLCVELLRREPLRRPDATEIFLCLAGPQALPEPALGGSLENAFVGPESELAILAEAFQAAQQGRAVTLLVSGASEIRGGSLENAFVGRETELASLAEAFQAAQQGRAVTLLVSGASGIGKSALVRRFTQDLERRKEALVLDGRCYEREQVPHKTLDRLIDRLTKHLRAQPLDIAAELLPEDAPLLAHIFKPLGDVPAIAQALASRTSIPDQQELRRRAFEALTEILRRLAKRSPLVLVIDDLQWGDVDSVGPLADLFSPPSPVPALIIGCYRDADAKTSPFLKALIQRMDSGPLACERLEIHVPPLPAEDEQKLFNIFLPDNPTLAHSFASETAGSPFLVRELAQHVRLWGGFPSAVASLGEAGLGGVVHARVAGLSNEERRLFEIVAIAGYPLREDIALLAAELSAPDNGEAPAGGPAASPPGGLSGVSFQRALANLRALHLVQSRPADQATLLEPYHDRIRESVVARIPAQVRKDRHLDLARALETVLDVDPQLLVECYREAGETARAAHFAERAAVGAQAALAFNRAAELYRLALELGGDRDRRWELLSKLGDALANAGKGKEAAESFIEAAGALPAISPADRRGLDLRRKAAEQYLRSGYVNDGIDLLRSVLAAFGASYPETPKAALISIGASRALLAMRGPARRLAALLRRASLLRREVPSKSPDRVKLETFYAAGLGLALVDYVRAAHFQLCHKLAAIDTGDPKHVARSLAAEVAFLAAEGGASNRERCRKVLKEAEDLAARANEPYIHVLAQLCAGAGAFYSGEWRTALERCREATRIGRERCTGVAWEMTCAEQVELWALGYLGDLAELSRRLPQLLKEARERDDVLAATTVRLGVPNMVWLAEDRPDEAEAQAKDAMSRWSSPGFTSQHYLHVQARAQIEIYRGDGPAALRRMNAAWPKLEGAYLLLLQAVRIELHHLRARAYLAAAEAAKGARPRDLLRSAAADARLIAREDLSIAAPFAALIRAGVASLNNDLAAAASELKGAIDACARTEMHLYEAAARFYRGRLLGGEIGRQEERTAADWMTSHGVVSPGAMAALLVPGLRRFA
jgi:hypothetical protein